ncbi:MAG: hypothetical protein GY906_28325 [bacterium]|nr:hypothetical protein [bacterium]
MQRTDRSQYFEVWVRSAIKPWIKQGSIVERDFRESSQIEVLAGAIAEGLCEKYNDQKLDPGQCARAAREAYLELNTFNPRPLFGSEEPL